MKVYFTRLLILQISFNKNLFNQLNPREKITLTTLSEFKTLKGFFDKTAKLYCFFPWHSSCEIIINIQPD